MFYVYVLKSKKDRKNYIGYTENLEDRIMEHNSGYVKSTRHRRPLEFIYFEGCLNQRDGLRREKYLKTQWGFKFLQRRLKNYFVEET